MAKAQYKKRIRSARHHANGIHGAPGSGVANPASTEPLEVAAKTKNKKNKSQQKEREATIAVLDKISSPSSHDRIWSLAAISNLVLSCQSTRQLLLSKNLVRLLIDRLNEDQDQDDVLVEVTGVLRNLVIEGGKDVCGEMANKGILQPLNIVVSKLMASITHFQAQIINGTGGENETAQTLVWAQLAFMAENVIIILWSLAETSNKWLDSVSALQDVVPLISTILKQFSDDLDKEPSPKSASARYRIPSSCALASGQCLYTLTEDHPSLAKKLAFGNQVSLQALVSLFGTFEKTITRFTDEENQNLELLQVVSVGILRNIITFTKKRSEELSFKSAYDEKMPQILATKLQVNLAQLGAEAAEAHRAIPTTPLSDLNIAKASFQESSPAELQLESIERRLTIVQLSLELVGEWCASADGFDQDADESSSVSSDADQDPEANEMDEDSNCSEEAPEGVSQNGDVDMEEIPTAPNGTKSNGVLSDSDSHEQDDGDRMMEIEESESFLQLSNAALFSNLLVQLHNLAQPTPYLYQSPESEGMPKDTIPAAASTNGVPSTALTGVVPELVNELLSSIHLRAIDALNNMMITIERLEGNSAEFANQFVSINQEALRSVWNTSWMTIAELFRQAHQGRKGKQKAPVGSVLSHQCFREQLLISTLTSFWSLSRVFLKYPTPYSAFEVTTEQTGCLMEIVRGAENDTLKSRALSILVCFAGRPKVGVEENAIIGALLIEIISSSSASHGLLIEALDGVFDIYADETRDYDKPVFEHKKFLESLQAVVPKIQGIVKKIDKRKEPILRQQAEAVQSNLMAFIEYRKGLA